MKMKGKTPERIAAIKELWEPGMSARMIADASPREIWGGKLPTTNAIVGLFTRWPAALRPCHLTGGKPPTSKRKPKPTPELDEDPVPEKVKLKTSNKNTKNVSNGFVAPPQKSKLPLPPVRDNYSLSDKALRKHLHEERMLARDKANISSPAYRFNPRKT